VVLLHGLTDSPYSLRHLAAHYRAHGFVAVTMRMPGHGTVPAGLTRVRWEDWLAAARLAMRHARALAGTATPLHLVGYSNGGALALKYALDALGDASLPAPTRIVLISPMIGITSFARFAGVLGWPAVFPPFAKAAWLDIAPEFNPVKYNSFPVNAARQSSQLTRALREQIEQLRDDGELERLAPVLTFQSAFDATVDVRALVTTLYAHLPSNGSELVLFDRNRRADASALVRPESDVTIEALLPPTPRKFGFTLVGAAAGPEGQVSAQLCAAGDTASLSHSLALAWPPEVYSLSHVALPFPIDDPLYGITPSQNESYGVRLGTVAVRGERGVLIVSADTLMRMTSNPFFLYLLERIDLTP
jgi:alpha-beta hydrolase superfamily lysophospholipase